MPKRRETNRRATDAPDDEDSQKRMDAYDRRVEEMDRYHEENVYTSEEIVLDRYLLRCDEPNGIVDYLADAPDLDWKRGQMIDRKALSYAADMLVEMIFDDAILDESTSHEMNIEDYQRASFKANWILRHAIQKFESIRDEASTNDPKLYARYSEVEENG